MVTQAVNSCFNCKHLRKEIESWEMPHIAWYECTARPMIQNLKNWPYKRTRCQGFERRVSPEGLTDAMHVHSE